MKIVCEILVGSTDIDAYPELTNFNRLVALMPEAQSGYNFRAHLAPDDPRIQQIVDFMRSLGKEPKTMQVGELGPSQFRMHYRRVYDQSDYEDAELLVPTPEVGFYVTSIRLPDGMMSVGTNDLRKRFALAGVFVGLVVSEEARQKMEDAGLTGLVFKPVVITGRKP